MATTADVVSDLRATIPLLTAINAKRKIDNLAKACKESHPTVAAELRKASRAIAGHGDLTEPMTPGRLAVILNNLADRLDESDVLYTSISVAPDGTIYGGSRRGTRLDVEEHGALWAGNTPDSWIGMILPAIEFDNAFPDHR